MNRVEWIFTQTNHTENTKLSFSWTGTEQEAQEFYRELIKRTWTPFATWDYKKKSTPLPRQEETLDNV